MNQVTYRDHVIEKHQRRGEMYVEREIDILRLLEKNFINEPKIDHYPFPRLVSEDVCNDSHEPHHKWPGPCHLLTMTHCGISVFDLCSYKRLYYQIYGIKNTIKPNNLYNTVECIINNLRNNHIMYRDFTTKNICINKNGEVYLIDFDASKRFSHNVKKIEQYYKKPDLDYLKEMFDKDIKTLDPTELLFTYKIQPWSMLYLAALEQRIPPFKF